MYSISFGLHYNVALLGDQHRCVLTFSANVGCYYSALYCVDTLILVFFVLIFSVFCLQTDKITNLDERDLAENMQKLLVLMSRLDQRIAPMLDADGEYFNQRYILV